MPAPGKYHWPGVTAKYSPTTLADIGTTAPTDVLDESKMPRLEALEVMTRSWYVCDPALVGLAVEVVVTTDGREDNCFPQ
jgi:hypothetical protein